MTLKETRQKQQAAKAGKRKRKYIMERWIAPAGTTPGDWIRSSFSGRRGKVLRVVRENVLQAVVDVRTCSYLY